MATSYLNLTFPESHNYEGFQFQILFSLNCLELFAHVLMDGPFSAINFLLIFQSSVLHPNLKFILLCQSACILLRAIARALLNIGRIWFDKIASEGPFILKLLFYHSTFVRNLIINILVIERIMATLLFKKYEYFTSPWFSIFWFTIASLIALFNASCSLLFTYEATYLIQMTTFISTFILGLIEVVAFVWIRKYNERSYKRLELGLTEKYQLSENIRTAKQLMPCILLHFVNILFGTIQAILHVYRLLGTDPFYYDLVSGQLVFTTSTIISFFIELCMILCHPFLKRGFCRLWLTILKEFLKRLSYLRRDNSVAPAPSSRNECERSSILMNIHGEPLLPNVADDLQKEHFRQLTLAWV